MLSPFINSMITDLFISGVPVVEKVLRTICVYFFLIILLRMAGKRTLGSLNSFDLVVLLLLSNTVQNALIGNDNSLAGGLVGAMALILVNYVVVWYLYHHRKVEHAVEGGSTILMRHGKYVDENLTKQLISRTELQAAARRQGIQKLTDVCIARLETGGSVTFELHTPTEQEKHVADLIARLERIEATLERLVKSERMSEPDAPQ
jgi:uncharacterized membrane protein YcaP (DUF421 family)